MKILALYLPQFHRVKENDKWWGEGFTEWTAVKSAKALFDGHRQPVVPLNDNYYDLLDYNTMKNQEALLKEYGLDGLCIYHYWFENGKRILEKPAENLLKWKDIGIKFCFSWANETWARSWSNIPGANVWSLKNENMSDTDSSGILLKQRYGDTEDWKIHFDYLMNFFKDDRYIKVDNKPVICIYKVKDIFCFENMMEYWRKLAVDQGFDGIYVIGKDAKDSQMVCIDERFISEPGDAISRCTSYKKGNVNCYDYDEIWQKILQSDFKKATIGGFVGYDDTPRRGEKGIVIIGKNVKKFKAYLHQLIKKNQSNDREFCILNAWNEWGEGMYLEPDTFDGYQYLSAVKDCLIEKEDLQDDGDSGCIEKGVSSTDVSKFVHLFEREKEKGLLLDAWLRIKEQGQSIFDIYDRLQNKSVAVYGYGILGRHLINELQRADIDLKFIIDQKAQCFENINIYKPDDNWPYVDLIIVTPTYDYGRIYKMIRDYNKEIEVVSLGHILMDYL